MILLLVVATAATGCFAGAAIYINAVEHPARMSGGIALALTEFRPSYRRATVMQASLAVTGAFSGLLYAWQHADGAVLVAALLLGAVIPFTLVAIMPTNNQLLTSGVETDEVAARALLTRWNRLADRARRPPGCDWTTMAHASSRTSLTIVSASHCS